MSHEFSLMILIAATLLLLAAVCGVLFWGMTGARDIADEGYTALSGIINASDSLRALQNTDSLPAAAVFALLGENRESITRLHCTLCGTVTMGTELGGCLRNHMHGRVKLTLTEEESGGTYTAVLSGG